MKLGNSAGIKRDGNGIKYVPFETEASGNLGMYHPVAPRDTGHCLLVRGRMPRTGGCLNAVGFIFDNLSSPACNGRKIREYERIPQSIRHYDRITESFLIG